MNIKFLTHLTILKCVIVGYFILYAQAQAPTAEYENSLLDDYRANGVIVWKWDPKIFCTSETPDEENLPAYSSKIANIEEQDIMLEQAACTKIRMEVLFCLFSSSAAANISSKNFFVNGAHDDIFHTGPPVLSICDDPTTFIIKDEVTGSVLIPRSIITDLPTYILKNEKALFEYHEVHGTVRWEWDLEPFCKSQIPIDQNSPANLRAVYTSETNLMLESVNCATIEVEILNCTYFIPDEVGSVTWQRRFYLNGLNQRIFDAVFPYDRTRCNDPTTLIIDQEITEGERSPRAKDRFLSYAASLSSIVHTEKLLAKYYEIKGVLKWVWNPEMFWRIERPIGYNVLRTRMETRDIVLEHADCTKIQMEVLHHLHSVELIPDQPFESLEHSYATGWNGELFHVNRVRNSRCRDDVSGVIGYEIHVDGRVNDRRTGKLSGIADIFKMFVDLRKRKVLQKKMWPKN